jgi:hypothetical protein
MLGQRVAVAAWRLARADRIATAALAEELILHGSFGVAVIRNGNGGAPCRRCCAIAARRWPSSGARYGC